MRVYRLEDEDGVGVYRAFDFYETGFADWRASWEMAGYMPAPWEDKPLARAFGLPTGHVPQHLYFAFRDVNQYREWFCNSRLQQELDKHGIKLNVYEVPDTHVVEGDKQVVFRRDVAQKIKTLSPYHPTEESAQ